MSKWFVNEYQTNGGETRFEIVDAEGEAVDLSDPALLVRFVGFHNNFLALSTARERDLKSVGTCL